MKVKGKVKFVAKDKTQFFNILKKRVDAYFEEKKSRSTPTQQWFLKPL
ncbi:MAG: hypothetical protein M0D57_12125 [Sphingobacteriales bacterium JAD_PAG50586_3]|nr:MAG: hypothetical protein M0D57_12125 [Sphingobacteriales bacterium JAD_PAG50586_3]